MTVPILSIDFETASTADLRRAGAHTYAQDPSTRALCMAWAFDDDPVRVWRIGQPFPAEVMAHVAAGRIVRGWNVGFEQLIWNNVLYRQIPGWDRSRLTLRSSELECTMARAAMWGLPLALDKAGKALNLPLQKNMAGHGLMLRMCRPRSVAPDGALVWWHETDPQKFDDLCDYCADDVNVERLLARALPPLPDDEKRVWTVDRHMNNWGVALDTKLVAALSRLAEDAQLRLDLQVRKLTNGVVRKTSQRDQFFLALKAEGYPENDLRRDTVRARYPDATGRERELLRIRMESAKASTAKLKAMADAVGLDGRLRGMLQYYGASRTGRWAGRLVQLQNLPRPSMKQPDIDRAIELVLAGADAEMIELLLPDTALGVVASCLRSTITAGPDKVLVSCDLSQIEARMVAWLAGQDDVLEVFARGEDIYIYDAKNIGSEDRQLGKVCRLGLGFGMGPDRFVATAKTYGIVLDLAVAQHVVWAWRAANPRIVKFWWDCDRVAKDIASRAGDRSIKVGKVTFRRHKNSMFIDLPSGRPLVYRHVRLDQDGSIVYLGVNQYTKQYVPIRTYGGKLVENITQAAARDVMRDAMLDLSATTNGRYSLLLSVHDELIAETDEAYGPRLLHVMEQLMTLARPWTKGLPIAAAGWVGKRYRKG